MRDSKQTQGDGMRPLRELIKDGKFLAKMLNEPVLQRIYEPIGEIASRLIAMNERVSQRWQELRSGVTDPLDVTSREREEHDEEERQFNALLEPYTWHIYLAGWREEKSGRAVPGFIDMPTLGTDASQMSTVILLARAGILDRLRKCDVCSKWFFSATAWGKTCDGGKCRKAKNRATPKARNKNRRYARDWYLMKASPYWDKYEKGWSVAEVREWLRKRRRARKDNHGKRR
jgi:hypothetical protein